MRPDSQRRQHAGSRIVLATSSRAATTSTKAVQNDPHFNHEMVLKIGFRILWTSCTRETPSRPTTELSTSRNWSGLFSVIQIDWGMSAAVIGEFGPSYLPGNCSLSLSKASCCDSWWEVETWVLVSTTFWMAAFWAEVTSPVQAGLVSWRLHR